MRKWSVSLSSSPTLPHLSSHLLSLHSLHFSLNLCNVVCVLTVQYVVCAHSAVYGVWCVVCAHSAVCGVWGVGCAHSAVCSVWCVLCVLTVQCVVCGVWGVLTVLCVVCGVCCVCSQCSVWCYTTDQGSSLTATDCFNIYDLNNDGYISREEMFQMLKTTVKPTGEEELDDYVKDLVEITIKMMVSRWGGIESERLV